MIKKREDELTASIGSVERKTLDKITKINLTQDGVIFNTRDQKKCFALTIFCIFNHRNWDRRSPDDPSKLLYPKEKFAYFAETATSIRTIWDELSTTNKYVLIDDVIVIYEDILIWNCVSRDYQSLQSTLSATTKTPCSSNVTKKQSNNENKLQQEINKKRLTLKTIEKNISQKIALLKKNKTLLTLKEEFNQPSDDLKTKSPLPEKAWNLTPSKYASDSLKMDQLDTKINAINNCVLLRRKKTGDKQNSEFNNKALMNIKLIRQMSEQTITTNQFSLYCQITQLLNLRNELLTQQQKQKTASPQVKNKKRKRKPVHDTGDSIKPLEDQVTDIIKQLQDNCVRQSKEKHNHRLSTKLQDNETYAELIRLWDPKTTQDDDNLYYLIRLRAHITRCLAMIDGHNTIKEIQEYQFALVSTYQRRGVIDEETMRVLTSRINLKNTELPEDSQDEEADYNDFGLFTDTKTDTELWDEFIGVTNGRSTANTNTTPFIFSPEVNNRHHGASIPSAPIIKHP